MKNIASAICISALFVLQGCVAPKLSPEEAEAKRTSTLNVYDDNQVVIKNVQGSGKPVSWSWTTDKAVVLALQIDDQLYNVKDISRITSQKDRQNNQDLVVYFRNGDKKTARAGSTFGPSWVGCNARKVCNVRYLLGESNWRNSFGSILTAIDDTYLSAKSYERDPKFEYRSDYGAVPNSSMFQELVVLDDAGRQAFEARLAAANSAWTVQGPLLAKKRAEQDAKARAKDSQAREQAIKAGQLNCRSTSYSCIDSSYSDVTMLDCGTFKSSVGAMKKDGWVAANVNSEVVRATVGVMCDHKVYHFYYKR